MQTSLVDPMSQDFVTEYIPRDDESEAKLVSPDGYGSVILTDEDVKQYHLGDLGIGFPPDMDER